MAKLNMVNMNTLFKKGYLLAGVMMAANMFVVNEMKAMNPEQAESDKMLMYSNNNLGTIMENHLKKEQYR